MKVIISNLKLHTKRFMSLLNRNMILVTLIFTLDIHGGKQKENIW